MLTLDRQQLERLPPQASGVNAVQPAAVLAQAEPESEPLICTVARGLARRVLVVFEDEAPWDLFDLIDAERELEQIFGRKVDLVEKGTIRNPFRRQHILQHHEVIYAS